MIKTRGFLARKFMSKQNVQKRLWLRLPSDHLIFSIPLGKRKALVLALLTPTKAWLDIQETLIRLESRLARIEKFIQTTVPGANLPVRQDVLAQTQTQEREIDIAAFLSAFDVE